MRRNRIFLLIVAIFAGITFHANAQAPYKHSIGVTLGTTQAVSSTVTSPTTSSTGG